MATLLFDPRKAEQRAEDARLAGGWKEHEKEAIKFRNEIVESRRGEKSPALVPMYHRRTGEVRWFNLDTTYAGWLGNAEACLTGQWRVATKEEEAAEHKKIADAQQAATDAKLAALAQKNAIGAMAAFTQQHLQQQLTPATPGGEQAKPSGKK